MLYQLIRPLVFGLNPERAHDLAVRSLACAHRAIPQIPLATCPLTVMGLTFPNPVGLAAGLDKNAQCYEGMGKLGFGFIEVGTVTPKAQDGNSKPRLFRLASEQAIINRMGFNNAGVDALVEQLKARRYAGILGVNLGKNKQTPNEQALNDYTLGMERAYPYADYLAINISSPNTAGLRDLQQEDALKQLLEALKIKQQKLSQTFGYKPIVVKIAPDLSDTELKTTVNIIKTQGIDGVIATNTTLDKSAVVQHPHGQQQGGLSGAPLQKRAYEVLQCLHAEVGKTLAIISVGGIMTGEEAGRRLQAGADLIQLYTGLIYHGPQLIRECIQQAVRINSLNQP